MSGTMNSPVTCCAARGSLSRDEAMTPEAVESTARKGVCNAMLNDQTGRTQ